MLVIRYLRIGKKNQPYFKVVVTDKRNPTRGGRFIDEVGFIDPVKKIKKLDIEKIKTWISKGAQPSDTAYNLFVSEKIIEGKKRDVHNKKKVAEGAAAPAAAPGAPAPAAAPAKEAAPEAKAEEKKSETPVPPAAPAAEEKK
jgi:small subunit ribosomal protein S16